MAVLSPLTPADAFPGGERMLARHGALLPQPDQLCGPFAASVALAAALDSPPSVVELARASGTAVWPHDVAAWRPVGAPMVRTGWDGLPEAASPQASGTNAAGLSAGIHATTGGSVLAVPVHGLGLTSEVCGAILRGLLDGPPVGVVANVDTAALDPESGWATGHFVVLWGYHDGVVGIADTYRELGAPGCPQGCREVGLDALLAGVSAAPGRGLLVLVRVADGPRVSRLLDDLDVRSRLWAT